MIKALLVRPNHTLQGTQSGSVILMFGQLSSGFWIRFDPLITLFPGESP